MELISGLLGNLLYVFLVLAFIAVVLLVEGLYLTWNAYKGPEAKRIEQRLRAMSASGVAGTEASILKQRLLSQMPQVQRWLLLLPRIQGLDRLLLQSGSKWTVAFFLNLTVGVGVATFLFLSFVPYLHWTLDVAIALGVSTFPLLFILGKRRRRIGKMEQQLPDALDLISRALKAGHALPSGLQMAGDETPDPIGREFRIVHDEVNYGVAVPTALMNLATRVPSTDMRYFVIAVLIQRETGGNLTELLRNISALIRERLKLLGKVRVLSAEGGCLGQGVPGAAAAADAGDEGTQLHPEAV